MGLELPVQLNLREQMRGHCPALEEAVGAAGELEDLLQVEADRPLRWWSRCSSF